MSSSMSDVNKKKRPLKLLPVSIGTDTTTHNTTGDNQQQVNPTIKLTSSEDAANSTSKSGTGASLDSFANVNIDGSTILVKPDELEVLQQLGSGQYGIVEKVRHKHSNYIMAVKRVTAIPTQDQEARRLLMDVDVLVKGTQCLNIIKFYGALLWEGDLWILMELMDCSLDKFYRLAHGLATTSTHVAIPDNVTGRIAADVVNALSYLHDIKIIHRDIKPSNILVSREGLVKLCDFGISGYLVNSVAKTYEAGCRPYMAPERIDPPRNGSGYDIKSDVWSLGITLIEVATGKYPYDGARDFFQQLKMICANEAPRLPPGKFTENFQLFLELCLQKDPRQRANYKTLGQHEFIVEHKNFDISGFVSRVINK